MGCGRSPRWALRGKKIYLVAGEARAGCLGGHCRSELTSLLPVFRGTAFATSGTTSATVPLSRIVPSIPGFYVTDFIGSVRMGTLSCVLHGALLCLSSFDWSMFVRPNSKESSMNHFHNTSALSNLNLRVAGVGGR